MRPDRGACTAFAALLERWEGVLRRSSLPVCALLLAFGCGRAEVAPGAVVWDSGDGEGSSSDAEDESTDVGLPDVPAEHDPCTRVDLLFVVDNSHSMADEQANLVASFPGFIAGIESTLGVVTDYHVGVVTTDSNEHNGIGCRRIGALTNRTGGEASSGETCGPYADGRNFMSVRDELSGSFACAAEVGIEGSGHEVPMDAMVAAIGQGEGGTMMCNEGFLRDDSLLVLTIITDEDDTASLGDPEAWYEQLVADRDPSQVIVLSLVGHPKPNDCIAAQWDGMNGAEIAARIGSFTEMFEFGRVGDVCAPDYAPFFTEALSGIADACHVAIPPA